MQLRSGVDIPTVSNWLGHKDVKTTMVYLQALRASEARQKVRGIDGNGFCAYRCSYS